MRAFKTACLCLLAAAAASAQQQPDVAAAAAPVVEEVITTSIAKQQLQRASEAAEPAEAAAAAIATGNLRGSGESAVAESVLPTAQALDVVVKDKQASEGNKAFWTVFYSNGDQNMIRDLGGNRMAITIAPWKEDVSAQSSGTYTGGKLEFKIKSAAVMPGVITAVYLASGNGRTGDSSLGNQDEIDIEFKGNEPTKVQSNVFMNGQENLEMLDLGYDSSAAEHLYAIEWDAGNVRFYIDGGLRRTVGLTRPLQNMQMHLSVWTTTGGWPGLIRWGGYTNWGSRGNQPVEALIEFTSYPNQA